jgi:hypothetical protein
MDICKYLSVVVVDVVGWEHVGRCGGGDGGGNGGGRKNLYHHSFTVTALPY